MPFAFSVEAADGEVRYSMKAFAAAGSLASAATAAG
jgi:hypothetical protein